MAKKVAIVGFALSKVKAPYGDKSFEIWGLNDLHKYLERYDRWFEIHPYNFIMKHKAERSGGGYADGLKKLECPIYMQDEYADFPTSVRYPIEEITKRFGLDCLERPYFTNQVPYMIALALLEGFEEIHLYGVDMAVGTEYGFEKPCCEYWLGVAQGMGVKIHVPAQSPLLKTHFLYGYEQDKEEAFTAECRARLEQMAKSRREAERAAKENMTVVHKYDGAIEDLEHVLKLWGGRWSDSHV